MSAALDRWLTRLYHAVGGILLLAFCAVASYSAGGRSWPGHPPTAEAPVAEDASDPARVLQGSFVRGVACAPDAGRPPEGEEAGGRRMPRQDPASDAPSQAPDAAPPTAAAEIPAAACGIRRAWCRQGLPDAIPSLRATGEDRVTDRAGPPSARAP